MTTPQIPLQLRWPLRQRFEYFQPGDNAASIDLIRAAATRPGADWVVVCGPARSGRTHLLIAACQAAIALREPAQYLPLKHLPDLTAALRGMSGTGVLALDDIDAVAGHKDAEIALFDLYNRGRAQGGRLLFSTPRLPSQLGIELPDLRSRLGACTLAVLRPLDDEQRRDMLRRQAARRGVELDDGVLDWLFSRFSRDPGDLIELVERIDRASLAARRKVTIPFLRTMLTGQVTDSAG
ncbi:DnaA regulatory inactivator Hda [Frateuria aurantia]